MNQRTRTIITASWVGLIGNLLLSLVKIIVGWLSSSQAVLGDGIDSLSDVAAYLVTLVTARITQRPPDVKYPYGYNRAETIASKALSFFIFFAGAQLFYNNLMDLVQGIERPIPSLLALYVSGFSVLGKLGLALWQFRVGRRTQSPMLIANAKNMQADIVLSAVVLVGVGLSVVKQWPMIDTILALLVSLWILRIGYQIFKESNTELMDGVDDTSLYQQVFTAVKSVPGVHNPHRARIRKLANAYVVELDIEVAGDLSVMEAHQLGVEVEQQIKATLTNVYDIMIHVEPRGNVEKHEKFGLSREDV
uniref:Cation diffusion facilitator family transporter n=1 Tax=Roseihalotalea indica TaxID=2867963 RepID=A0AA49GSA3_9BACT|nr:cation diffusion facilitator family transporter [Tunicatimonas sp. TK19036]